MKTIAAVAVLSLLAPPLLAQEPSLAELAERQKKARKGQTKVITEHELRNLRTKAYVPVATDAATSPHSAASPAASGAASGAPAAKSDEELRAEKKAEIDKKIKQWTDFIAETKKAMDEAQRELNDLSSLTFGSGSGGRRGGLQRVIDEGKQHIAEAEAAIAALEEEGRRAGIRVSR